MFKFKLPKTDKRKGFRAFAFIICVCILVFAPILAVLVNPDNASAEEEMSVLTVWQIDGFEGGKGSRVSYLQNLADEFSNGKSCYFKVTAVTAAAARLNIAEGNTPDIISYGAGMYGIENLIKGKKTYYTWCRGGYCLLSISEGADFSDYTAKNTVINGGTDNFVGAAALLSGLHGSAVEKPTSAYVKLLNGEYKYLLGTQRDIFRLRTRGAAFSVKPITIFNDLYQDISVTSTESKKIIVAEKFIGFLLENSKKTVDIGLFFDGEKLYDDELSELEGAEFTYKLKSPISESSKKELENAIINCDENKLKNLLK